MGSHHAIDGDTYMDRSAEEAIPRVAKTHSYAQSLQVGHVGIPYSGCITSRRRCEIDGMTAILTLWRKCDELDVE